MTTETTPLWGVDHEGHCEGLNFYSNEPPRRFKSWRDFAEEFGASDKDLNLVFRWGWREGDDWELEPYTGDDNYRSGELQVCFMGQGKGLYWASLIEVCRAVLPFLGWLLLGVLVITYVPWLTHVLRGAA